MLAGYLNVPSDTIKAGANLAELPSVFIVLLGILSDSRPICGLRRRPYMAGGWLLAAACCFFLIGMGLPAPYYCFSSADERYQYEQPPCNPDAVEFYVPLMASELSSSASLDSDDGMNMYINSLGIPPQPEP